MTKIKQAFGATALLVLALPILVLAKSEEKNNWKVPEAKDIKIHKKQLISEEERKALDEAAKGKPADRAPKVNVPAFLATGVLGDPLPKGGKDTPSWRDWPTIPAWSMIFASRRPNLMKMIRPIRPSRPTIARTKTLPI